MSKNRHKLVFLGDSSVGKSCIACRFVRDEFSEFQEPTIGAAYLSKDYQFDDKIIHFEIWDTAGQERYRSLAPMYYRGASAALVIYDITNNDSFNGAKRWIEELKRKTTSCFIILLGNKIDLKDQNDDYNVNQDKVLDYVEENKIIHLLISAKTGKNINNAFDIVSEFLIENNDNEPNNSENINNIDLNVKVKQKSRCC